VLCGCASAHGISGSSLPMQQHEELDSCSSCGFEKPRTTIGEEDEERPSGRKKEGGSPSRETEEGCHRECRWRVAARDAYGESLPLAVIGPSHACMVRRAGCPSTKFFWGNPPLSCGLLLLSHWGLGEESSWGGGWWRATRWSRGM
jgi:hypothetical protein